MSSKFRPLCKDNYAAIKLPELRLPWEYAQVRRLLSYISDKYHDGVYVAINPTALYDINIFMIMLDCCHDIVHNLIYTKGGQYVPIKRLK